MPHYLTLCPLLLTLTLVGCFDGEGTSQPEAAKLSVYAVNYPLAYFAERIGGEAIRVVLPEIDGDPAFWKPRAADLAGFQNADLILLNGAGYAKWLEYATLPQSRLVQTSAAFKHRYIQVEDKRTHSHGDGETHAHGVAAFTTWLDPLLAVEQAAAIDAALPLEDSGLAGLRSDLLALDESLAAAFGRLADQPLIGSHPVYQYLQRRYTLDLRSLHWEPDVMPDEKMWQALAEMQAVQAASVLLWEAEPLPEITARLNEMGIQSIVFDPCGNRPKEGDFLTVMRANLANIESLQLD